MRTLSLAAAVTAALVMAGCGTSPAAAPGAPSPSATSATSATTSAAATPSETPSASASPSGTVSSSASTSTSAGASASASSSASVTSPRPSPSSATTEPGQAAANGTIITFPPPGIALRTEADINSLVGASPDLKKFLVNELGRARTRDSGGCASFLSMDGLRVPDLASGGVGGCGGGAATLWAQVNGTWKVVVEGQDAPQCSVIRNAGLRTTIPAGFYGSQCVDAGQLGTYKP